MYCKILKLLVLNDDPFSLFLFCSSSLRKTLSSYWNTKYFLNSHDEKQFQLKCLNYTFSIKSFWIFIKQENYSKCIKNFHSFVVLFLIKTMICMAVRNSNMAYCKSTSFIKLSWFVWNYTLSPHKIENHNVQCTAHITIFFVM